MEILRAAPFLDYLEKVRARTLRVIACIPSDRIEWTYKEGKFTFGDVIRHLGAVERYMFVENARLRPSRYPGHGRELADGYKEVLAFFNDTHTQSVEVLSRLTDEDLMKKCVTPGGASITVWKWLRSMIEHEVHHRGQLYLYLAMIGVESPPLYGLTSEEVYERSKP